jgi:dihydrofolate reductase
VKLAIIAALARNRAIGKDNNLPWHISEDLQRFKRLTMGHTVLMGRKTYASMGKPLPGRRNVVVSRSPLKGVETYTSLDGALGALADQDRVFVIGGGEVYAQVLERVDELFLTMVDREVDADTFFPPFEHLLGSMYQLVSRELRDGYAFEEYARIPGSSPVRAPN